jgi:RNA polymerase sigma-70 factor (ECF subfamily)
MKMRAHILVNPPVARACCSPRRLLLADGLRRPEPVALSNGATIRTGDHLHVNDGRRHMANADTRVSVIVGVCQQDPDRWREFDRIYRPILYAYLRARDLNDADAENVVQDTFVKLLGKIHTYDRAQCRFRTWLFSVTHNTLVDHARRRASYKKAIEGWAAQVLRATTEDSIAMELEFEKLHREKILAHALKDVRARVSPKAWACFSQRLLKNRTAAEIAADLKIEPNAVYIHAHRVLKQVREVCEEFDEDISHAFDPDVSR